MKMIDKDALVAEIEKLKKAEGWCQVGKDTADVYYARGFRFACERIIDALNTLEVKEIDLEKETKKWWKEHLHLNPENKLWMDAHQSVVFAKHFYELGMQQSKK